VTAVLPTRPSAMTAVLPARPSAAERRAAPSLAAAVRDLDRRRARTRQRTIGASELGECRRRAAYRIARRRPTNTRTACRPSSARGCTAASCVRCVASTAG
jgi:hypothetical protein